MNIYRIIYLTKKFQIQLALSPIFGSFTYVVILIGGFEPNNNIIGQWPLTFPMKHLFQSNISKQQSEIVWNI